MLDLGPMELARCLVEAALVAAWSIFDVSQSRHLGDVIAKSKAVSKRVWLGLV